MKKFAVFALTFIAIFVAIAIDDALAAKGVKKAKAVASKKSNYLGAKLGTEHNLGEMNVTGRYFGAYNGVAEIENEKQLNDLLDYRKHYNDRIKNSQAQF